MKKLIIFNCVVIGLLYSVLFLLESCTQANSDDNIVTVVDGEAISLATIDQRAEQRLYHYLFEIYYMRKYEAQKLISEKLLQNEAKARHLSVDQLLNKEIESKMTAAALQKFVVENDFQMGIILSDDPFHPLDIQSEEGIVYVNKLLRKHLLEEYVKALQKKHKVTMQLKPPLSPQLSLTGVEKYPLSSANPAKEVLIVGNFACTSCKKYKPLLDSLLQANQDRLSFAYVPYNTRVEEHDVVAAYLAKKQKFNYLFDTLYRMGNLASAHALITKAGEQFAEYEAFKTTEGIKEKLEESFKILADKSITRTPTLLIDGRIYHGHLSMEAIQEYLNQNVFTN